MNHPGIGPNPLNDIENLKDRNALEKDINALKAFQQAVSAAGGLPGFPGVPPGMTNGGQPHSPTMAHLMAAAAMAQQQQQQQQQHQQQLMQNNKQQQQQLQDNNRGPHKDR